MSVPVPATNPIQKQWQEPPLIRIDIHTLSIMLGNLRHNNCDGLSTEEPKHKTRVENLGGER